LVCDRLAGPSRRSLDNDGRFVDRSKFHARVLMSNASIIAFATKLHDVVGLYLESPAHSPVLSVDEKSQIQNAPPHLAWPANEEGSSRDDDP
jgi:hypothetical protein